MTEKQQDAVDRIAEQWARERPDLDVGPMLVIGRLHRLAELLDQGLRPVFAEAGLGNGDFDVLASLRRSGPPYRLSPTQLAATTMVTSGAVTGMSSWADSSVTSTVGTPPARPAGGRPAVSTTAAAASSSMNRSRGTG